MRRGRTLLALVSLAVLAAFGSPLARADDSLPPFFDADDVPMPAWARSVEPRRGDMVIFDSPSAAGARRGVSVLGARLPLFAAKRGGGCASRWLQVAPMAWVCSDTVDLSADEPAGLPMHIGSGGLPFQYFFVGRDGATAYARLDTAGDAAPDRELEPGWAVAVTEQRTAHGERWGRTNRDTWVAMRELFPAHPSLFHGEQMKGVLDVAWVLSERAVVFSAAGGGRAIGSRLRFQRVGWKEEKGKGAATMVRISDDGAPAEWMFARDLSHPTLASPPDEIGGEKTSERWIDVHLPSQTLVAYDGTRPIYATLVSTGRGPRGSDSATPPGFHRIWVKLQTSTMDNVERNDVYKHYSMEDVPYVMFFDKAVALHGAFWHNGFGRVRSHGCVNVAPLDARWLFEWTLPRLPLGWQATYPTRLEPGTAIRVRP